MNQRIAYIDIAKGLAMIWVIMGHITANDCLRHYIYSFHMMVFFFISGVLMNVDKYPDFKGFAKSRVKSLYVPFFCLYMVLYAYWLLVERGMRSVEIPPLDTLVGVIWGSDTNYWIYPAGPLWFVVCLFSLELTTFPLLKAYRSKMVVTVIAMTALFGLGVLLTYLGNMGDTPLYCLPMGLNNGLVVIPFYFGGYVCRDYLLRFDEKLSKKGIVTVAAGCTIVSAIASQYLMVDISYLEISNWMLYLVVPYFGIASWLAISNIIGSNRWIEWIGRNTLPVLAFHGPIIRVIIFGMSYTTGINKDVLKANIGYSCLILVATTAICIPCVMVWNKVYDNSVKKILNKS